MTRKLMTAVAAIGLGLAATFYAGSATAERLHCNADATVCRAEPEASPPQCGEMPGRGHFCYGMSPEETMLALGAAAWWEETATTPSGWLANYLTECRHYRLEFIAQGGRWVMNAGYWSRIAYCQPPR